MTEHTSRADAAAAADRLSHARDDERAISTYTGTIELAGATSPEFLPLAVRRVLYIVGLAALVVAPTVGVEFPEYAQAITTAGNLLGAAALGTALANPPRS